MASDPCGFDRRAGREDYYGARCTRCALFYARGCAPWEEGLNEYDDDRYYDGDDDFAFDCHMMPGGWCGAAGSEDCEFECPYRT